MGSLTVSVFVIVFALISYSVSIIRNDITDRCLHLRSSEKMKYSGKLPVYARSCSWDAPEHRLSSHKNEHLEIVGPPEDPPQNHIRYSIIRLSDLDSINSTRNITTCMASSNNEPGITSTCDQSNPRALFSIHFVPQANFKGSITSKVSFKIINEDGHCLTVRPGWETLQFRECTSRHGLFQVWSVCRHNRQCDVDLTWTPRKIHFPENATTNTSTPTMQQVVDVSVSSPSRITPPQQHVHCATHSLNGDGVTNDLLYTIQNALRIYAGSEAFLASSLDAFYPNEVIIEAAKLTQNICSAVNLECELCTNRKSDMPDVIFLIKWMTDCNVGPSKTKFLSENVLRVLLHLFPVQDSLLRSLPVDYNEKIKLVIPSLKKYLREMEANVKEEEKLVEIPPMPVMSQEKTIYGEEETDQNSGAWEPPPSHGENGQDGQYKVPILLDIDIRTLGRNSNNLAKYNSSG